MRKTMQSASPGNDWRENVALLATALLVLLWAYAAFSKLWERERFVLQMQLVPIEGIQSMAPIWSWLVPMVEILILVLLFFGRSRNLGCWFSFVLLGMFELYIGALLLSKVDLPCTCGGLISKLQWKEHLVFNAFFMVVSMLPVLYGRTQK